MLHNEWLVHLNALQEYGTCIGPRGMGTRELLNRTISFDGRTCLLDVPSRGLNYRFAVAEFVWMAFGQRAVEPLSQFNQVMSQFSDDGITLTGAYGPHICGLKQRVLRKLKDDPNTRQAVIVIPRPSVYSTKDEPCTLAFQLLLRGGKLHGVLTMRSSDAWLGVPYDAFTFGMLLNCFAGELGVEVGRLTMNLASAHLYDRDLDAAQRVLTLVYDPVDCPNDADTLTMPAMPGFPPFWVEEALLHRNPDFLPREALGGPWEAFARCLFSATSDDALNILRNTQLASFLRQPRTR